MKEKGEYSDILPLCAKWIDALLATRPPHCIFLKNLPGWEDENSELALLYFCEKGFLTVDTKGCVHLTKAALYFFAVHLFHLGEGATYSNICRYALNQMRSQGIDTSVLGILKKTLQSRKFFLGAEFLSQYDKDVF